MSKLIKTLFLNSLNIILLLTSQLALAELPVFHPLVLEANRQFDINPAFEANSRTVVEMAGLSYNVARHFEISGQVLTDQNHELFRKFSEAGWTITPFKGKTGYEFDDVPGIVAFHPAKKLMIVALHGSRNRADWISNFDAFKADNSIHSLGINGRVHSGFAVKVKQFKESLLEQVSEKLAFLTQEEVESLSVFVTGHSQGAALAHLAGFVLAEFFRDYFGNDFDNSLQNKIQLYRISAPRTTGDQDSYDHMTRIIGKHNDIRHNVEWDPVPSLPSGKAGFKFLSLLSSGLANEVSGYLSNGYLAMQYALPTIANNSSAESGSNLGQKFINAFKALHLGSKLEDGRSGFNPALVDSNIRNLLVQGAKHKASSRARKNTLGNAVQGIGSGLGIF